MSASEIPVTGDGKAGIVFGIVAVVVLIIAIAGGKK